MLRSRRARLSTLLLTLVLASCGDDTRPADDGGVPSCEPLAAIELGDPNGHPEPLGAGPSEARAGRIDGAALPPFPSGLGMWDEGGFVLANDRVAMVIEDVGPSHLYDPWGGRPLGIARVEDGALVDPADFGEILVLTGRFTVMTTSVTVLSDGSDGGAAIVRASGPLQPLPFYDAITAGLLSTSFEGIDAAIDYVLEPGANHVDVRMTYVSPRSAPLRALVTLHGFMFTPRMPVFAPDAGFDLEDAGSIPFLAFTDERGVSFAYAHPTEALGTGVSASGFVSRFTPAVQVAACTRTEAHHARITIGGPGIDGLLVARASDEGTVLRTIEGVVRDASGAPASGVRVHATSGSERYLTRSMPTGDDGRYVLHVAEDETDVSLIAYRQGDAPVGPIAADGAAHDIALGAGGWVRVVVQDELGGALPARIQVLPRAGSVVPGLPARFGEEQPGNGRAQIALEADGEAMLRVPAGRWTVVMSRGYEYELVGQDIEITTDGEIVDVTAMLSRVIEQPGVLCADFHIHTRRSNDSADDEAYKIRGALADGLEIPVRSDHEYVADFTETIAGLDAEAFAYGGIAAVELTSMELWGHMGVVPLMPDPTQLNAGAPRWQEYPTADSPETPLRTMSPVEVFDAARARPERPTVIINHPRGDTNYFGYVGYDPVTGTVEREADWDDEFTAVEFFNDADWLRERDRLVTDWLSFLDRGRRVFAVGSSDSHSMRSSPVGYPRTCMALGVDEPNEVDRVAVRDALAQGHSTISGGIYVDASVGDAGPGDELTTGATAMLHVRVQAASWIDVDALEIVVDGRTLDTIEILPADAPDPALRPHVRFERDLEIDVAAGMGSYVIVAAYGDATLEPVHPGRIPFGVTNPIFLRR